MDDVKISSNRSFGIVFILVFLIISLYPLVNNENLRVWSLILSLIFLVLGLINSKILTPLNKIWFKFGIFLGKIISPFVMGIIFFLVVTPIGILMRVKVALKFPLILIRCPRHKIAVLAQRQHAVVEDVGARWLAPMRARNQQQSPCERARRPPILFKRHLRPFHPPTLRGGEGVRPPRVDPFLPLLLWIDRSVDDYATSADPDLALVRGHGCSLRTERVIG